LQGGCQANGFNFGAGVSWLLNRHMRVTADYDFTDQRSTSNPTLPTTGSYTRSVALLALRWAL